MEVNLASQTQNAPQVKYPHIEPVNNTVKLIKRPIGEIALAIVNDVGDLNTNPIILTVPIIPKNMRDSHAAGTCINIILNDTP
tara:strand:+ start:256 stop:504 length:249 start_codon:yes stop_codon:yes gene_type:complete